VVVVSYSGKEINAKLVYYGAGLSGKTTNLESIYEAVPESSRGKMVSMKTQSDRTLFFDLLPLDLGEIMGFKTRFLLYTVPGQVFYNATRKLVLKGADAIVFVADSEVGKMDENKESLANLRANLIEYDLKLDEIPWVIQYNKRDLANVYSIEELNAELNPGGRVPNFEAVATQGKGVFETFRGISHLLMEKVTRELRRAPMSGTRGGRTDDASARPATTATAGPTIPFGPANPVSPPAAPATPRAATTPATPVTPVASGPAPTIKGPPTASSARAAATPTAATPTPAAPAAPARPAAMPIAANGSETTAGQGVPPPADTGRGFSTGPMRASDQGTAFQYGRELSLPSASNTSTPETPTTPPASHPHAREIEGLRPIEAGSDAQSFFESRAAARPTSPAATEPPAHVESRAPVSLLNETGIDTHRETDSTPARPGVGTTPRAEIETESADAASGATELVVPVAIPRGTSREIVLRIVITGDPA
jgi:hypothetical protein